MGIQLRSLWQSLGQSRAAREQAEEATPAQLPGATITPAVEIAPNDPIIAYFLSNPSTVEIDRLHMTSPALKALKEAGVQVAVPLVSQGELVGLLSLGPRLSEQDYSTDDRRLLTNLATQAAPALRVAQLARQQQAEARERERFEQELRVASIIQQTLLPERPPEIPGWHLSVYWQPARSVGGDFYDFITLPDGQLCLIVADVTDKGVPAALVMASARSVLRAAAERLQQPGEILARANDIMCAEIPSNMFITCLCVILDTETGHMQFANAGHNLPYLRTADGVVELRATGMPLGLMPGMPYEEAEFVLEPGHSLLFHSDGMVEAHNPDRELYGFERLQRMVGECPQGRSLIDFLLAELGAFTGPDWEQEDDVTFVLLERQDEQVASARGGARSSHTLAEFSVDSAPGNERQAIEQVSRAVADLNLPPEQLDRLKTAVGETTMNAMEHGNRYRPDAPVSIRVFTADAAVVVHITDQGKGQSIWQPEAPDLDAKLAGMQSARGWGLFLIQNMVDELNVIDTEAGHTVELIVKLEGGKNGNTAV